MKRWWRLWSGHVFLAVALVSAYWFFLFGFECVKSLDANAMLRYFLFALAALVPSIAFGILAATRFRTKRQRYYIAHDYTPTGGHRSN
jgi:hypothetical protein